MVRLAHFSDVHLTAGKLGWSPRDLIGKRPTGWVNVKLLGRGRRFRHANDVVAALRADLAGRGYDHLVFTGDATTLAFDSEMAEAARRLGVGDPALPPTLAVPGNHDRYTFRSAITKSFEREFGPWQHGDRVDDSTYPFARKAGHVWLIGLDTTTANVFPWDASGKAGEAQLDRLKALCERLGPGPRIVATHYPLLTADGVPENRWHRLRDWKRVRDAAAACGVSLWLNGHKHRWYVLPAGGPLPFPLICAGSSAQTTLWAYHEYRIDGWHLSAVRRLYDPAAGTFQDGPTFEVELPPGG